MCNVHVQPWLNQETASLLLFTELHCPTSAAAVAAAAVTGGGPHSQQLQRHLKPDCAPQRTPLLLRGQRRVPRDRPQCRNLPRLALPRLRERVG